MEVSHLLFADDTLVFYGFLCSNDLFKLVPYVAWAILGLKINLVNKKLILVEKVEYMEDLAFELSCKVGDLPFTYLGLPLGALLNQWRLRMGWKRGFVKSDNVEKVICFQRGETHFDLEHFI